MNNITLPPDSKLTMSSVEISELTGKRHADVKRDIENVLNQAEIDISRFAHVSKNSINQNVKIYRLPKRECDLVISGYSVKYRLAIIDRWHQLEEQNALPLPNQLPPAMPELGIAESAARLLRMSSTSIVRMLGIICEDNGINSRFLPDYSDETFTKALGDLLKEHGSTLSARAANPILMEMGVLEELERRTARGGKKKFKSLTEFGLKYGKNETSKQNPNETQPRYYTKSFKELLDLVDEWMSEGDAA